MKKKEIKLCWIQDSGVYDHDTFIFIGHTKDEVLKKLKKYTDTEGVRQMILDEEKSDFAGVVFEHNNRRVLWMPVMKDKWKYFDYLMHEVHHLTLMLGKQFGFSDELEASAYLFNYLFKAIRKRIYKVK